MKKACIWLGPAVVCLQIYCWSPAIYVPNERQNYQNPSQASQAQNWLRWIRQTNGKIWEDEKAWELILSFCLLSSIWKYLDNDEELQIGQPAVVAASFLKTTTILTPICLRKASWILTFTDRLRIRKEPETAPKRINWTIKNRNHHRLAPNLEHLASIWQN